MTETDLGLERGLASTNLKGSEPAKGGTHKQDSMMVVEMEQQDLD